ncbi:hypothetical protein GZL_01075 [Streptomyces sp. 769]|nr:hypothetical protein GZL_01075 [Streptomyces sp. 769]
MAGEDVQPRMVGSGGQRALGIRLGMAHRAGDVHQPVVGHHARSPSLGALVFRAPCLLGLRGRLAFHDDRHDPFVVAVVPLDCLAARLARVGAVLAGLRVAGRAAAADPEPTGDQLVQGDLPARRAWLDRLYRLPGALAAGQVPPRVVPALLLLPFLELTFAAGALLRRLPRLPGLGAGGVVRARDTLGARAGRISWVPSRRTMVTSEAGGRSYARSSGAATYDCPFGPGH